MKLTSIGALNQWRQQQQAALAQFRTRVQVCCGTGCLARGAEEVLQALQQACVAEGVEHSLVLAQPCQGVYLLPTGCHGLCQMGPQVRIWPQDWVYHHVKPADAREIVQVSLVQGKLVERLVYRHFDGSLRPTATQIPFYQHQVRIATQDCGALDPQSLEAYVAAGGFAALAQVLSGLPPGQVISMIEESGLRGRGGGGYPTGRKWRACAQAPGQQRYIIGNGDEGDPGAFMDLALMEGVPYRIIEGMIIGAYAVGARSGYLYVRNEYPLAVQRLQQALQRCYAAGLLGPDILGCGLDFDLQINRGGGAFVCGESSALMRSLEGRVGEPRAKYIHSVVKGLYDQPTVLNNVETWACVPAIITKGAAWFAQLGTADSKGTKAFSLVGKVVHSGLIEVPMGTSIQDVVFKIGGGIIADGTFKAVQTGGPSGGCIPAHLAHLPLEYAALNQAGSMMGSGGLIVMDQHTCMVDLAKYFIHFLLEESCGKCVPCREGLRRLHLLLERITQGEAQDLEEIRQLCQAIKIGSLCGLGQSAVNPVLSTLRYYEEEYRAHIQEQKCPAGVCRALIHFRILENCVGCGRCREVCPADAIAGEKKQPHRIDPQRCLKCGACVEVCPVNAIVK